jgi:hypothetical protein
VDDSRVGGERADPSIAAAVDRLDEAWLARVVAERLAQLAHRDAQHRVDDVRLRPHGTSSSSLVTSIWWALDEIREEAKRVRGELDAPLSHQTHWLTVEPQRGRRRSSARFASAAPVVSSAPVDAAATSRLVLIRQQNHEEARRTRRTPKQHSYRFIA